MVERLASLPAALHPDAYISDLQAAALLSVTPQWLRNLRCQGGGCRFYKLGRSVRYKVAELTAWAEARAARSTSELEAA